MWLHKAGDNLQVIFHFLISKTTLRTDFQSDITYEVNKFFIDEKIL